MKIRLYFVWACLCAFSFTSCLSSTETSNRKALYHVSALTSQAVQQPQVAGSSSEPDLVSDPESPRFEPAPAVPAVSESEQELEKESQPISEPSRELASAPVIESAQKAESKSALPISSQTDILEMKSSKSEIPISSCVKNEQAADEAISNLVHLSDRELFEGALNQKLGKCYIVDARKCDHCACEYYIKSSLVGWSASGWPMNPVSLNSTGCVSYYRWGGYSADMATPDLIHNGAQQLRDALMHPTDPCGIKNDCSDRALITPQEVLKTYEMPTIQNYMN